MVRRFDEILSQKASKQRLANEYSKIDQIVQDKFKAFNSIFEEIQNDVQRNFERFDEFTILV